LISYLPFTSITQQTVAHSTDDVPMNTQFTLERSNAGTTIRPPIGGHCKGVIFTTLIGMPAFELTPIRNSCYSQ